MEFKKKLYTLVIKIVVFLFGIDNAKKFDTKFRLKKNLNLKNPQTLADKVTYIELHKQSPLASKCTDKYAVRNYIKSKGLEEILIPIVGGPWDKVEEIDFSNLEEDIVIKATHGCKMNYIITNKEKLDIIDCKKELNKWLKTTYGKFSIEPHYFNIPHRLYAEKYLKELDGLIDYKFHCINGEPEFVLICSERKINENNGKMMVTLDLFDKEWKPIFEVIPSGLEVPGKGDMKKPSLFEEMKEIARKLSKDFDFVRVDLYQVAEKLYFGELTFSPACCVFPYFTDKFLLEQGKKLKI